MSKFRVRATFNDVAANIEFDRKNPFTVNDLKQAIEKAFSQTSFSVKANLHDGSSKPVYQDAHLQDALQDAIAHALPYISVLVSSEAAGKGLASVRPGAAPVATGFVAPAPQVPTSARKNVATASTGSADARCPNCDIPLPATAKFCSGCGARTAGTTPQQSPTRSKKADDKSGSNETTPVMARRDSFSRAISRLTTGTPESADTHHRTPSNGAVEGAVSGSSGGHAHPGDGHCFTCGKEIISGITALDRSYHRECFVCSECHTSLVGQGFQADAAGNPICGPCYVSKHSTKCAGCGKAITGVYVQVEDKEYHKECFVCSSCSSPFGGSYISKNGKKVCKNCA